VTADPTVRFQCTGCGALDNRHVVHLLDPIPEGAARCVGAPGASAGESMVGVKSSRVAKVAAAGTGVVERWVG